MVRKWYSLIDKAYRMDNLHQAYRAVRSNSCAPGVYGETVEEFDNQLRDGLDQIHH